MSFVNPDSDLLTQRAGGGAELSPLETFAIGHAIGTSARYSHFFRNCTISLLPIATTKISANVTFEDPNRATVVLSLGFIRLLAALAARLSIRMTRGRTPYALSEQEMRSFDGVRAPPDAHIHEFDLAAEKRRASDLTEDNIKSVFAGMSGATTMAAVEYLAAALEFVVLHEFTHALAHHRHNKEFSRLVNVLKIEDELSHISLARAAEHHADSIALYLMWMCRPRRPLSPDGRNKTDCLHKESYSRSYLSFAGAGIVLSAAALQKSIVSDGEIFIGTAPAGGHPSAISRLPVATMLFINSIKGRPLFRLSHALPLNGYENVLNRLQFAANFHSMFILTRDWSKDIINPDEFPAWLKAIYSKPNITDFITQEYWDDLARSRAISAAFDAGGRELKDAGWRGFPRRISALTPLKRSVYLLWTPFVSLTQWDGGPEFPHGDNRRETFGAASLPGHHSVRGHSDDQTAALPLVIAVANVFAAR